MTREDRKESMAIIQAALDQAAHDKNLLTYEEAAKELHRSYSRIASAASEGILHPVSLPGTSKMKYIHRDEVEWFKQRALSEPNAILYRESKKQPEPPKSWTGRVEELFTENEIAARFVLQTLIFALSLQDEDILPTDDIRKKRARSAVLNIINTLRHTEEGRAMCKDLAAMLVETLTSEELSSADRKLLKETLDVLLDIDTQKASSMPVSA